VKPGFSETENSHGFFFYRAGLLLVACRGKRYHFRAQLLHFVLFAFG
jgi:hypothetical protein